MKKLLLTLALSSLLLAAPAHAQEAGKDAKSYTYAPSSPTYWRKSHQVGGPGESFVFRRDSSVWVYTPELARLSGLPLEWVSSELKGAEAVAFRMAPTGEEDCGFGGQLSACKPVVQCTLDIYFDREKHLLPWAPNRMVADFKSSQEPSANSLIGSLGWTPIPNGNVSRGSKTSPNYPNLNISPFSDPQTGEELFWRLKGVQTGGGFPMMAYDREIHSRLSFLRTSMGCDNYFVNPKGAIAFLSKSGEATDKQLYEIFFPFSWGQRVQTMTKLERARSSQFFQQTLQQLNPGANK